MRKITFIIFLLLCVGARAGNVVSLPTASGAPGEEVTLTVTLANDDAVSAVQLQVPVPDALTVVEGSEVLTSRAAGHSAKVITAGKATKFAVSPEDRDEAFSLVRKYGLRLTGVNQHIGSQFLETEQYLRAVDFLLAFVSEFPEDMLRNLNVLDFGGGFGIPYHKDTEKRLDLRAVGRSMDEKLTAWMEKTGYQGRFLVEPGRYIVGECGLLLGSVEAVKNNGERRYVGTDLGFNVLVRPVMYDSFHEMEIYAGSGGGRPVMEQTITGNICESGDILAKNRSLPEIREGDLIGVLDAGAYGFSMSSTYNERMRPAEVLLTTDGKDRLIRRRETLEDLSSCLA